MDEQKFEKLRRESLENSLKDCMSTSAMTGFGDNFISPYLIAMNAKPYQIGLLTSLPNLISPFSQIIGSKLMTKISRKSILSFSTLFQGLMWLPIILAGYLYVKGFLWAPTFLILFYSIYAFFGSFGVPAWVSWMGDLVKEKELGTYFGLRNSIGTLASIIAIILAGFILDLTKIVLQKSIFIGFSVIFILALIFRFLGRHFLLKQYEPKFVFEKQHYFSFIDFLKKGLKTNFGKFVIITTLLNFSVNIVGPYFNIYILKDLKFSYLQFMILNVVGAFSHFIFSIFWGRIGDKFSHLSVLKFSSFLISLVSLLWFFTIFLTPIESFYYLIFVNIFSGFSWSAFTLASGNFFYLSVSAPKRGLCASYSQVFYGLGVVAGAMSGSLLLKILNIYINPIILLAIISGILRMICAFLFLIFISEPTVVYMTLFPEFIKKAKILQTFLITKTIFFFQEIFELPRLFKIIFKRNKK